jgi:hypothetical protein
MVKNTFIHISLNENDVPGVKLQITCVKHDLEAFLCTATMMV